MSINIAANSTGSRTHMECIICYSLKSVHFPRGAAAMISSNNKCEKTSDGQTVAADTFRADGNVLQTRVGGAGSARSRDNLYVSSACNAMA